jgi:hypothetical protein
VLAFLAALLAAAPTPSPPPAEAAPATAPATAEVPPIESAAAKSEPLETAAPWWEKITVTVNDQGQQASCRYETSAAGATACDKAMADSIQTSGKGTAGVFKKVTFERRFSPGGRPDAGKLAPGDLLLGRAVMYLTIDAKGAIASCKTVSTAGDSAPSYGCDEIKQEQFRAEASASSAPRQAFMTVSAYGHLEQMT